LHEASAAHHAHVIERLLEYGVSPTLRNSIDGNTALHCVASGATNQQQQQLNVGSIYANESAIVTSIGLMSLQANNANAGAIAVIDKLLAKAPELLESRNHRGETPLLSFVAASRTSNAHHLQLIEHLLECRADAGATLTDGTSALQLAVAAASLPVMARLLERGAEVPASIELSLAASGDTILHRLSASEEYCRLLVPFLQGAHAVPPERLISDTMLDSQHRRSALHVAAKNDVAEAVELLLSHGGAPLLTHRDAHGQVALQLAVQEFATNSIAHLLDAYHAHNLHIEASEREALATARDGDGNTILHAFARSGLDTAIERLVAECGTDAIDPNVGCLQRDAFVDDGTPLHAAARTDQPASIRVLLRLAADVNHNDNFHQRTPLHVACQLGARRCVEELLRAADVNLTLRSRSGESILEAAEDGRDDECIAMVRSALGLPPRSQTMIVSFDDL